MSHILRKYLISIFLLSISLSDQFNNWLIEKKELISQNEIIMVSFLNEFSTQNLNINRIDSCYIIFYPQKKKYQLKFLNNIIYYDGFKMDQYNESSKQLFRYEPDKIVVKAINKLLSDKIFKRSKYQLINNISVGEDSILINSQKFDTILYKTSKYSHKFYDIDISILDSISFNDKYLFSKIDTTQIEIFNFIKR